MFVSNFSKIASDPYYLVVYDQILDPEAAFGTNLFAHVIKNIDIRKPTFYKTVSITGLAGYLLNDLFPYHEYMVAVGKADEDSTKSLTKCNYDLLQTFSCNTVTQKPTPVSQGLVGLDLS